MSVGQTFIAAGTTAFPLNGQVHLSSGGESDIITRSIAVANNLQKPVNVILSRSVDGSVAGLRPYWRAVLLPGVEAELTPAGPVVLTTTPGTTDGNGSHLLNSESQVVSELGTLALLDRRALGFCISLWPQYGSIGSVTVRYLGVTAGGGVPGVVTPMPMPDGYQVGLPPAISPPNVQSDLQAAQWSGLPVGTMLTALRDDLARLSTGRRGGRFSATAGKWGGLPLSAVCTVLGQRTFGAYAFFPLVSFVIPAMTTVLLDAAGARVVETDLPALVLKGDVVRVQAPFVALIVSFAWQGGVPTDGGVECEWIGQRSEGR